MKLFPSVKDLVPSLESIVELVGPHLPADLKRTVEGQHTRMYSARHVTDIV